MFGLPGNPVSSHVSFELFARPALRLMMGHDRPVPAARSTPPPAHALRRRLDGKLHLDRVVVEVDDGALRRATARASQASNVLAAHGAANGLALLPDGDGVEAGDRVTVMLLLD